LFPEKRQQNGCDLSRPASAATTTGASTNGNKFDHAGAGEQLLRQEGTAIFLEGLRGRCSVPSTAGRGRPSAWSQAAPSTCPEHGNLPAPDNGFHAYSRARHRGIPSLPPHNISRTHMSQIKQHPGRPEADDAAADFARTPAKMNLGRGGGRG
jgi:hypothetical protein